ncbi:MarR family winged helix-turn-helix transcriptional regulator [Paenibacillus cremeus]|uniref:MarR family transcriptional regulator n=1 Tax=Paenibacillus cremeus TaxID=2163881 RepID=A0A559K6X2_9BACL|nr:MarR family transcriptional regulator [Paenibacillus cremeus]TVY07833.1 MarR family transcriptional regulator [Paenibacillus cremeus]
MTLDNSLGFILNHTGRKMSQLLTLQFQPHDITTEQWTVLHRLAEQDGISQKELAKRAEKDQTNITRILDHLERKGLVERRTNAEDRRSFLTYITEAGRTLDSTLVPIENQVIRSVLHGLTEEQIQTLRELLLHLTRNANQGILEWEEEK